jgi:hypothetical protein
MFAFGVANLPQYCTVFTHPSPQLRTDQGQANCFLLHRAVLSSTLPTRTGSVASLSSAGVVAFAFNPTTIDSLV